jgi:hypothetical protein
MGSLPSRHLRRHGSQGVAHARHEGAAMTPEGKVKAAVRKVIESAPQGTYSLWPPGSAYGKPALDVLGARLSDGRMFAVEVKADYKPPTPRQRATIRSMTTGNVTVFVIDEVDSLVLPLLGHWLNTWGEHKQLEAEIRRRLLPYLDLPKDIAL